jgi:hypothetical protein
VTGIEFVTTNNSKVPVLAVTVGISEGVTLGLGVVGDKVGALVLGNLKKKI